MRSSFGNSLDVLTWNDVKKEVASKNPEFAAVADQFNPDGDFRVYKARYPFGASIINNGIFYLPINNAMMPINDPELPTELQVDLKYNHDTMPLALTLKNSSELTIHTKNRLVPNAIKAEGSLIGLWIILDPSPSYHNHNAWCMTAGARNIFVLPKIKDFYSYQKLCRARNILKLGLPDNLLEQQKLLVHMSQHSDFPPWECEVLLFSAKWLEKRDDEAWVKLQYYFYKEAWDKSAYWRNAFLFDMTWDSFVKELALKRVRIIPQAADIVKHLLTTASGVVPGFGPAITNEQGPIDQLQKDFYEIYGLDRFAATIMVPRHFSLAKPDKPVYWSFHLPTYFESTSRSKSEKTTLSLMYEVHEMLEHFCEMGLQGKLLGVVNTPIYDILEKVRFDFFHSEEDPYKVVKLGRLMAEDDPDLLQCPEIYGKRELSEMGPFVRGCVRISAIKK